MKKLFSFILSFLMCISFICVNAYADEASYVLIKITQEEMDNDAFYAIESALKEAKNNASDNYKYKIIVPSGKYTLTSGLHIYSNTILVLQNDTVLKRGFDSGNMIKAGIKDEINSKYKGYKDITIQGGIWDSLNIGESCAMRFAHCTNLTLKNVTVKNVRNAHHIETAAVNGLYITDCIFNGYERTKNTSGEAVQLDIIHNPNHFPDYGEYDDTPCKNVYIKGCQFKNVFSGVGTRSGVIGSYFDNIQILSNTFSNIDDKAISCFNYKNCKIKNNTIKNATVGIFFEYFPVKNLTEKLYMPNDANKKIKMNKASNTIISNNEIVVKKRSSYNDSCGITVFGSELKNEDAQKYKLAAGKYYIYDINISKNKITTKSSESRGMILGGVKNSKISSNDIVCKAASKSGINGINLTQCTNNLIYKNNINGKFSNAVSVYNQSKKIELKANSIKGVSAYGIYVSSDSSAQVYSTNKISASNAQLLADDEKADLFSKNAKIKRTSVSKKHKAELSWNKVKGASGYYVYRSDKKNGSYEKIAAVKGASSTSYTDNTTKKNKKYYYKICPYKKVNSTVLIGKNSSVKKIYCK